METSMSSMTLAMIADKAPYFQYGTTLYIVFSDGAFRPLSLMTRFRVRYMGLSAKALQKELRPGLVHTIEAYKQSQAYAMRNKIANPNVRVSHTTITAMARSATQPISEIAPSATYFVWIEGMSGPAAQLWAEDYTLNPNNGKPKENYSILKKIELKPEEAQLSIGSLMAMYPYPEQEPGAC